MDVSFIPRIDTLCTLSKFSFNIGNQTFQFRRIAVRGTINSPFRTTRIEYARASIIPIREKTRRGNVLDGYTMRGIKNGACNLINS